MIVADTNLIAYLLIGGTGTSVARSVFLRDPVWAVPLLWRSEFRNILAGYVRRKEIGIDEVLSVQEKAEQLVVGNEHLVESRHILHLVPKSTCSAHDCEFVALAERLAVPLVTSDRRILRDFPSVAIDPLRFLETDR